MLLKNIVFVFVLISLSICPCYAQKQTSQEAEQQISDFQLSGFGDKGRKSWQLSGKTADIFEDQVKLKDITGDLYGEKEDIRLKADKGDFNKKDGTVHLEDNVLVTTSSGAKLTTDSLDWDRKNNVVRTDDRVNIERENMITQALGAVGQPGLKKVTLEKDVQVNIAAGASKQNALDKNKITITCDGPMEIDYEKNIAVFSNNVKVDRDNTQIYSDRMEVYFIPDEKKGVLDKNSQDMSGRIEKICAKGNVKIVRGENISYSDEAVYTGENKKITLLGRPRLIIYSSEDINAPSGN